jgi:transcriptional regulator NrdR family protein
MPKEVIKRNGSREPFIKEKIVTSAVKAGAPVNIARRIAREIEDRSDSAIHTKNIRTYIFDTIELHNPDVIKKWISYDKNIKRLREYH